MNSVKSLFKSLLTSPSTKKWSYFNTFYKTFYAKKEPFFDEAVEFVEACVQTHNVFPTFKAIEIELTATEEPQLLSFFQEVEREETNTLTEESEYLAQVKTVEKTLFETNLFQTMTEFHHDITTLDKKDIPNYLTSTDTLIAKLHKMKDAVLHTSETTSGLFYGEEERQKFEATYDRILKAKNDEKSLFFTLGWKKLENVKICRGDLLIIGGFTSHGKSILLRNIIYRLLTEYGLNCFYSSLEMSYETVLILFNILHANNRERFPHGYDISYEKFRDGLLSKEERAFLFEEAAKDFANNPAYGNLYLECPNKSRYRLSDIKAKITELENTLIPVHVVAVDYLTLLYPIATDKGKPEREDYNQMIKEFKNMALSHRDLAGNPSPFIAITPAQISRGKLDEAVKNNHYYDLSALREYTELEASADIVLTTMLLPEMRQARKIKIQHLKNRNGDLDVDPKEFSINLNYGFNIMEAPEKPNRLENVTAFKDILI